MTQSFRTNVPKGDLQQRRIGKQTSAWNKLATPRDADNMVDFRVRDALGKSDAGSQFRVEALSAIGAINELIELAKQRELLRLTGIEGAKMEPGTGYEIYGYDFNVWSGKFDRHYVVREGDAVLNRSGASIGNVTVKAEPSSSMLRLCTPDDPDGRNPPARIDLFDIEMLYHSPEPTPTLRLNRPESEAQQKFNLGPAG